MSVKLMSWAFDLDIPPTHKLILLALADRASDEDNSCYPGQKSLAKKTSCGLRTVQRSIDWLCENGLLEKRERRRDDGYRTSDFYTLMHDVKSPRPISPANLSGDNLTDLTRQSDASQVPICQVHIEETSEDTSGDSSGKRAGKKKGESTELGKLILPTWVSPEAWDGFCEMRKSIRKPMTDYAKKLAIGNLEKLRQQGHDPTKVLEQSILKSWQGLFPVSDDTQTKGNGYGKTKHSDIMRAGAEANIRGSRDPFGYASSDGRTDPVSPIFAIEG